MRLARFLAEISRRNRSRIPTEIDPIGIILMRGGHPNTQNLVAKGTFALIAREMICPRRSYGCSVRTLGTD